MLVLAITLHNIPEGLAVGVLFGGAALGLGWGHHGGGGGLAIGIGIQNFRRGCPSACRCVAKGFLEPRLGGTVNCRPWWSPLPGLVGAAAVMAMRPILALRAGFAAGAMLYVVVEEVIPETQRDKYTDVATLGFIGGFIVMMSLDVGLG